MTLVNWQTFGFEFHLRSSPSAYIGFVNVLHSLLHRAERPNKVETAVHGCNLAFSLDSIVSLYTNSLFWVIFVELPFCHFPPPNTSIRGKDSKI